MPLVVITACRGSRAVSRVQNQQNMYKSSSFASLWWERSSQNPEPFVSSQRFPSPTPGEFPSLIFSTCCFSKKHYVNELSKAVGNTFYYVKMDTKHQKLIFSSLIPDLITTAVKRKSSVGLRRIFAMEFETSVISGYFWLCVM